MELWLLEGRGRFAQVFRYEFFFWMSQISDRFVMCVWVHHQWPCSQNCLDLILAARSVLKFAWILILKVGIFCLTFCLAPVLLKHFHFLMQRASLCISGVHSCLFLHSPWLIPGKICLVRGSLSKFEMLLVMISAHELLSPWRMAFTSLWKACLLFGQLAAVIMLWRLD